VATCTVCGGEMLEGVSCSEEPLNIGGRTFSPIRWGDETHMSLGKRFERCGDCWAPRGGVHHHGCDLEQCPACGRQMLSCDCRDDLDLDYEDDLDPDPELGAEGSPPSH
jgi:hypothetical protein